MILYYATFRNKQTRYWAPNGTSFVSYDSLPEPIKDNIAVLDLAATSERIPGVGQRGINSYHLDLVDEDGAHAFYTLNKFEDDECLTNYPDITA